MENDIRELQTNVESVIQTFTEDQKKIFDTVMKAVKENESCQILIAARGRCGKTTFSMLFLMLSDHQTQMGVLR